MWSAATVLESADLEHFHYHRTFYWKEPQSIYKCHLSGIFLKACKRLSEKSTHGRENERRAVEGWAIANYSRCKRTGHEEGMENKKIQSDNTNERFGKTKASCWGQSSQANWKVTVTS